MADNIVGQLRTAAIMQKHEEVYCPDLLREAADEIERLRALITAWVDADIAWADAPEPWGPDTGKKFADAVMALRKEARRD